MAKIAIIDDAIYDELLESKITSRYCYSDGKFYAGAQPTNAHYTHGTIVAKMLESYAVDFTIVSIQLLEDWFVQRRCPTTLLSMALRLCTQLDIDIVHISLGTTRLSECIGIDTYIQQLTRSGIPIIAACSNEFYRTLPAAYSDVFGVICDKFDLLNEGEFAAVYDPYLGTNFIASSQSNFPNIMSFTKSNSLAATVITACVNQIINDGAKRIIPTIYCELKKKSRRITWKTSPVIRSTENQVSVPIVQLIDVFPKDKEKQSALLNEFCSQGYEVAGITCVADAKDIRLIHFLDVRGSSLMEIQRNLVACTKSDLVISFLDSELAHILAARDSTTNSDALCISNKDLSQTTIDNTEYVYSRLMEYL